MGQWRLSMQLSYELVKAKKGLQKETKELTSLVDELLQEAQEPVELLIEAPKCWRRRARRVPEVSEDALKKEGRISD